MTADNIKKNIRNTLALNTFTINNNFLKNGHQECDIQWAFEKSKMVVHISYQLTIVKKTLNYIEMKVKWNPQRISKSFLGKIFFMKDLYDGHYIYKLEPKGQVIKAWYVFDNETIPLRLLEPNAETAIMPIKLKTGVYFSYPELRGKPDSVKIMRRPDGFYKVSAHYKKIGDFEASEFTGLLGENYPNLLVSGKISNRNITTTLNCKKYSLKKVSASESTK